MKSFKQTIKEDIQPGYAPDEISFGGYTTKNLHHSADAAKAFQETIEKANRGEIKDKEGVLHALKATDTYMKLNDMHLEQGKAPDEKELAKWKAAHEEARMHLHKIGEFMHHMDYWHMHEHELQDMETKYTPATAGAEMSESYIEDLDEAAWGKDKMTNLRQAHERHMEKALAANKAGDDEAVKTHQRKMQMIQGKMQKLKNNEEVDLDEAVNLGTKVKIHAPGKSYHGEVGHVGEIRHGAYKGAPKTYTVDYGNGQSIQLSKNSVKMHKEEVELEEELTDKTIKAGDKIKVARVIADMLGVEKAESMSPDVAVNQGLRKVKNKRMTPEMIGVVKKMLALASEVGIKVDQSLVPKAVSEEVVTEEPEVDTSKNTNGARSILRMKDYTRLAQTAKGIAGSKEKTPLEPASANNSPSTDVSEVGHSIHPPGEEDQMRRRKVMYKTEEAEVLDEADSAAWLNKAASHHEKQATQSKNDSVAKHHEMAAAHYRKAAEHAAKGNEEHAEYHQDKAERHADEAEQRERELGEDVASADYKVNPETGRKYRAHKINFANSGMKDKLDPEDNIKEEVEMSDDDLEKLAKQIDHEDDILDLYDDGDLVIIDQDTGEEVKDHVSEELLNELLSRAERMRARIRFLRTKSKRERRLKIVLKRRSDQKTIVKRARRLAINLMKQRFAKKPVSQMTVSEKERVERMLQGRGALIDRLAMRLVPRIRRIESDRLSHQKTAGQTSAVGV